MAYKYSQRPNLFSFSSQIPEVPQFYFLSRLYPRRDGHQDSVCCSFPPPEYNKLPVRLSPTPAMSTPASSSSGLRSSLHHQSSPPVYLPAESMLRFVLSADRQPDCQLPLLGSESGCPWSANQPSRCHQYRSPGMREERYHRRLPLTAMLRHRCRRLLKQICLCQ